MPFYQRKKGNYRVNLENIALKTLCAAGETRPAVGGISRYLHLNIVLKTLCAAGETRTHIPRGTRS